MKKIILVSLTLLLSATMLSPIVSLAESNSSIETSEKVSINNADATLELEKFSAMQDDITSVLKVESGKYVYDAKEVKAIVDGFDFDTLAEKTGIEFTNESFFEDAIINIENTTLKSPIQSRNANRYNRNYYEGGWNYDRRWMDTKTTTNFIFEYRKVANDFELGGPFVGVVSKVPQIQFAISIGFAYDIWYFNNVADNTEKKNNGTGVVFEINLFTAHYSVWSQEEYK